MGLGASLTDDRPWGGSDPPGVAYLYAPDRKAERKRSSMALLSRMPCFMVSPSKLWGFEPKLWSTLTTTRRVLGIGGWRS